MKSVQLWKVLMPVLCAMIFWTACQKEISNENKLESPGPKLSGVTPDDPELLKKVPLLMSVDFVQGRGKKKQPADTIFQPPPADTTVTPPPTDTSVVPPSTDTIIKIPNVP